MVTCPTCGAEFGFDVVLCPNCGHQIQGESVASEHDDSIIDSEGPGDTIDHGGDHLGSGAEGHGGIPGPDTTPPEQWAQQIEQPMATDAVAPQGSLELDAGVPGSEIPPERGGGATWGLEDDAEPPDGLTESRQVDSLYGEVPDRDLGAEGPRGTPRRPIPWWPALVLGGIVLIAALFGFMYLGGDDDGNDEEEHNGNGNGNGPPPVDLIIIKTETALTFRNEPIGTHQLTVTIKNVINEEVDLTQYEIFVTAFVDDVKVDTVTHSLSGALAGTTTDSYDIDVKLDPYQEGDDLLVSVMIRTSDVEHDMVDLHTITEFSY